MSFKYHYQKNHFWNYGIKIYMPQILCQNLFKSKKLNSMLQCFCSNNGIYYDFINKLNFNLNEMYISFILFFIKL
jgi:hypothetical protein